MTPRQINCAKCGKEIIAKAHNSKYCKDCARQEYNERSRKRWKRVKEKSAGVASAGIVEVAVAARAAGMTYGEYVGRGD